MSSRYVCLSTGYFSNAKTLRLASKLGKDAFHLPLRLICYAGLNQPDADFSNREKYTPEILAKILEVKNGEEAERIVKAMEEADWFEPQSRRLKGWHDWNEFLMLKSDLARKAALKRWGGAKKGEENPSPTNPDNPDPPGNKKAPNVSKVSPRPRNETTRNKSSADEYGIGSSEERKQENGALSPRDAAAQSAALERKLRAINEELEHHTGRPESTFPFKGDTAKKAAKLDYTRLKTARSETLSALSSLKI